MIIDKAIKMSWNSNNKKYYLAKGYVFTKMFDEFIINIEDLNVGSCKKVKVECDICRKTKELPYREYIKSISNGGYYSCSQKCSHEKSKNTCISNYNVEAPSQSAIIQKKTIDTNIKRYGTERPTQSDIAKNKIIDTYGNFNENKKKSILVKIKEVMLEKYGVENVSQNIDVKNKQKQTCVNKYGVENVFQNEEIKEKIKETNLFRYGVEYPLQNPNIFMKNQKSQFNTSQYKDILYQGSYELDFLRYCDKIGIINNVKRGKHIKYLYNNKEKIYHFDFYVEDINLIVEIKSSYHYNLNLDKNILKRESCIKNGYDFIFIIDKNYSEFYEKIKKLIKLGIPVRPLDADIEMMNILTDYMKNNPDYDTQNRTS